MNLINIYKYKAQLLIIKEKIVEKLHLFLLIHANVTANVTANVCIYINFYTISQ